MDDKITLASELCDALRNCGFTLATAESCTGGAVASAVTSCPGCSDVYKGSVVAYSNEIKSSLLGVSPRTLAQWGAVSEQTVREMALGVQRVLHCDCAVATSGIAGPAGGTDEKPIGTVWVAAVVGDTVKTELLQLGNKGRAENICETVKKALSLLLNMVHES